MSVVVDPVRADRSPAHRALAKAAPDLLDGTIRAIEAIADRHGTPASAHMDFERAAVARVVLALGVRT